MVKRKRLAAVTALVWLAVAGCGGDGATDATATRPAMPEDTPTSTTSTSTTRPAAAAPAGGAQPADPSIAAAAEVVITNFAFTPGQVTVKPGDVVKFTNNDGDAHTTTAENKDWDGSLGSRASYSVKFNAPGSYPYRCDIHGGMDGTVVVA